MKLWPFSRREAGQIEPREPERKEAPAPAEEAETGDPDPIAELLKLVGEPNVVPFDRRPR